MPESTLVPNFCRACDCWSATEVVRARGGWMLQCTHCGNVLKQRGGPRAFRVFLAAMARFQQKASAHYPDVTRLTVRGAHVSAPLRASNP